MRNTFNLRRSLLALALLAGLSHGVVAQTSVQIGVVVITSGQVQARNAAGQVRNLSRRDAILADDTILVGAASMAQIRMADDALFEFKAQTEFTFDDYQYDANPDTADSAVMSMVRGGFRTISGTIGDEDADTYRIDTPMASIGIRGTTHEALMVGDTLFTGVYTGGTTISNNAGSIDTGIDGDFDFSETLLGTPPAGLLVEPMELNQFDALNLNDQTADSQNATNQDSPPAEVAAASVFGASTPSDSAPISPVALITATTVQPGSTQDSVINPLTNSREAKQLIVDSGGTLPVVPEPGPGAGNNNGNGPAPGNGSTGGNNNPDTGNNTGNNSGTGNGDNSNPGTGNGNNNPDTGNNGGGNNPGTGTGNNNPDTGNNGNNSGNNGNGNNPDPGTGNGNNPGSGNPNTGNPNTGNPNTGNPNTSNPNTGPNPGGNPNSGNANTSDGKDHPTVVPPPPAMSALLTAELNPGWGNWASAATTHGTFDSTDSSQAIDVLRSIYKPANIADMSGTANYRSSDFQGYDDDGLALRAVAMQFTVDLGGGPNAISNGGLRVSDSNAQIWSVTFDGTLKGTDVAMQNIAGTFSARPEPVTGNIGGFFAGSGSIPSFVGGFSIQAGSDFIQGVLLGDKVNHP